MLNLPIRIIQVLHCFEEAFSERVREWAKVLLIGAILTPGERAVTAILRAMGLSKEHQFQNYHRVLNRAKWLSRALSCVLLCLLGAIFVHKDAPIVVDASPYDAGSSAKLTLLGNFFTLHRKASGRPRHAWEPTHSHQARLPHGSRSLQQQSQGVANAFLQGQ